MRRLVERSRRPIGVDIGERQIRAVQLNLSSDRWRIKAAASLPRAMPGSRVSGAEVHRLHGLLDRKGFTGKSIVLAVPNDKLLTGVLELPPRTSGAPIEQLARSEFARMHQWDAQSFEIACWDLPAPGRATNSTFVMAAACTHAGADELLDAFEGEGFDVRGLDTRATAAARACGPLLADVSGIAAILDIGWTSAQLVLWYEGVVVYERNLPKGGLGALAKLLPSDRGTDLRQVARVPVENAPTGAGAGAGSSGDLPHELLEPTAAHFENIVQEMRIPLSYVANQYPDAAMERLLLIGDGAGIPGLKAHLASALELAVHIVAPADLADYPETVGCEPDASLTVAVGLGQFAER